MALTVLSLVSASNVGNSKPSDRTASEGYRLAEAWCKSCHAIDPHMAGILDHAPSFEVIANRHGTTELSLKVFLRTSHQDMPDLVIAPDQADALANYILSLKTN
jgi:mono/diheme cytochrome c family protein